MLPHDVYYEFHYDFYFLLFSINNYFDYFINANNAYIYVSFLPFG